MREEHILITIDGPHSNIIKFKPPMVFTKENVDAVMSTLDRVFKEYREKSELFEVNTTRMPGYVTDGKSTKEHRPIKALLERSNIKSI